MVLEVTPEADMALRVTITILHVIAVSSTIFRFYCRKSLHRIWWDDVVSLFAAFVDCLVFALLWMVTAGSNTPLGTISSKRIRYWLTILSSIVVKWANNITFVLSMARGFRSEKKLSRLCICFALLFLVFCLSIIVHVSILCRNDSKWVFTSDNKLRCAQSRTYRIFLTVLNVVADAVNIAIPAFILRFCRLPLYEARLLWPGLGAAVFILILNIPYTIFNFAPAQWEPSSVLLRVRMCHLEVSLSLIASHVFFLTTLFYHHYRNEDIEPSEANSVLTFTDIEVNSSDFELESTATRSKPASVVESTSGTNNDH